MRQMDTGSAATARVTVLMTPAEKASLEARAENFGISVGELVRRSVDSFDPSEAADLAQLSALAAELGRSNVEAAAALDRALASIEQTRTQLDRRAAA